MPTQEQQREYTRLSGLLQDIGLRHYRELPKGAKSLRLVMTDSTVEAASKETAERMHVPELANLMIPNRHIVVEVCDVAGKIIGEVPNASTPSSLTFDLAKAFGRAHSPDPDGVVAIL
jgi:chemotaxis response regulator CheB